METINHIHKITPAHTQVVEVPEKKIVKTIVISPDLNPESPREWDNLGTMYCWHHNYTLGDEQPKRDPNEQKIAMICEFDPDFEERFERQQDRLAAKTFSKEDWAEFHKWCQNTIDTHFDKYYISHDLYLYDHSGLTMSTGSFSCRWDSGQVGFIAVSKEKVRKEYGWPRLTKARVEKILGYLDGEVETYATYLEGAVYGFTIYEHDIDEDPHEGEYGDSCWGFYGYDFKKNSMTEHWPDDWETAYGLAYDYGYDDYDYRWERKHDTNPTHNR